MRSCCAGKTDSLHCCVLVRNWEDKCISPHCRLFRQSYLFLFPPFFLNSLRRWGSLQLRNMSEADVAKLKREGRGVGAVEEKEEEGEKAMPPPIFQHFLPHFSIGPSFLPPSYQGCSEHGGRISSLDFFCARQRLPPSPSPPFSPREILLLRQNVFFLLFSVLGKKGETQNCETEGGADVEEIE